MRYWKIKEPDYTCPQIDKCKEYLNQIYKTIDKMESIINEQSPELSKRLREKFGSIYFLIDFTNDDLEKLRQSIMSLREWGERRRKASK